MPRKLLRYVLVYLLLTPFAVVGLLAEDWSARPHSAVGWLLMCACAIPFTLVSEGVGELLLHNPWSRAVAARTQATKFSWTRIG